MLLDNCFSDESSAPADWSGRSSPRATARCFSLAIGLGAFAALLFAADASSVAQFAVWNSQRANSPNSAPAGWVGDPNATVGPFAFPSDQPPALFWVGASTAWDTTTSNWVDSSGSTTNYADTDTVNFDDTYFNGFDNSNVGSSGTVVIGTGGVSPATVSFNNSTVTYTLSDLDGVNGILGSASISKTGTGTVNLNGPNSFTGLVSIAAGQINVANSSALGSSSGVTVSSGAALELTGGLTIGNIPLSISGTGLASSPNGTLRIISGATTYGGLITVGASGATITNSTASALALTGGMNLAGTATISSTGPVTISNNVSGAGGFNLNNSGATIIFTGNNSFAGGISNPGNGTYYTQTIQLNGANAGGTGTISSGTDSAQQNTTLNLRSDTSGTFSVAGVVYNQTEDYNGSSTTINIGPLTTGTNQTLTLKSVTTPSDQSTPGFFITGSAGYSLAITNLTYNNSSIVSSVPVIIGTAADNIQNGPIVFAGTVGGTVGKVTNNFGTGVGGVFVQGGTWTFTGANTYGSGSWTNNNFYYYGGGIGGTEISGATTKLVSSQDLSLGVAPGSITANNVGLLNGGTLRANASFTLSANRGIGIGNNTGSTGDTGTFDVASGQTLTYNGIIASSGTTGTVNLITTPSGGTLILGGANTYNGTTTVAGGTLRLNNSTLTTGGAGAVSVASGATLGGNGTVRGPITLNGAAALSPGFSTGSGSLALNNQPLTLQPTTTSNFVIGSASPGVNTVSGTQITNFGTLTYGGTLNVTAVGSPSYAAGEVYTLFPGITSESGTFSAINLPNISADNLKWSGFSYTTGSITILPVGPSFTNPEYTLAIAAAATNAHVGATVGLTTTLVNTGGAITSDSFGYTGLGATLTGGSGGTIGGPTGGTGSGDVAYNDSGFTSGLTYTNSTPGAYTFTAAVGTTIGDDGTTPSQNGASGMVTINFYSGQSNWNTGSGGNWSSYGNWDAGGAPGVYASNPTGDSATFGTQGSGPISVSVDVPVSLTTLTFNSTANSYTLADGGGSLTLNGSGAAINVTGNHMIAAPVTLASNTTVTTNNSTDSLTISGAIGGSGAGSGTTLTTAGPGLVVLAGNNTYTGGTTIGGGTLRIGNGGSTGLLGAGPITDNGTLAFDRSDTALVVSTGIVGSGSLSQIGAGMTTLSGANSYGGGTNINAGTLEFPQPANMPATGAVAVAGGATLAVGAGGASGWTSAQIDALWNGTGNGTWASGGILGIDSTGAAGGTFTYASNVTDGNGGTTPMGLAEIGAGALVLTGTNSFSGGLYINGGTVSASSDANLGAPTGGITFNGGTLRMTTAFNPSATRPITVNANGGIITSPGSVTIASNISGAGGFTLNVSGTTIFSGNNSFAGGIFDSNLNNTIQLNGATAGGTGTISTVNHFAQENITLNLRSDTSATFTVANVVFNQTDDYTGSSTTINVGPLTAGANQTLTLNSVTAPNDQSGGAFTISGSAGYTLGINTLTMAQSNSATINANAKVQIGTLNWTPYDSNGVPLTLQGTAGGTIGRINSAGGGTVGGIAIAGGTWTLTGANSFGSGPWTANGNYFAAGGTEVIGSSSVLVISNDSALGTIPGSPTNGLNNIGLLNGGTLRANASFTLNANRGIGIGNNTGAAGDTGTIDVASGQTMSYNGNIASSGTTGAVNLVTTPSGGTLILGGADTLTGTTSVAGGTLNLVGTGNISGAAIVAGGTLILGGTNNVSGAVTVNAGTLRLNGSLASTSAVTVGGTTASGASGTPTLTSANGTINGSLTVSGSGAGVVAGHIAPSGYLGSASPGTTLNLAGALTLTTGSALDFNLSNSTTGANDQLNITGSGAIDYGTGGVLNINAYQSGALAYGDYVLINNASGGTLAGGTSWTIGANTGASPLQSDTIAVVGNNLNLIVSAVSVFWTGANPSWDTNPSNTASWVNASGSANAFATGIAVSFGDTYPTSNTPVASSGGNVQVTIQDAGVVPGSGGVIFSNSTLNYIISNATPSDTAGIGGATGLTLNGTKNVTLAGANSFSGPVAVNSGQLILANSLALGNASSVTVASGAVLSLQSGNGNSVSYGLTASGTSAIPTSIAGTGGGSGALVSVSGNNFFGGAITLAGNTTISSLSAASGDGLTLTGGINNNGNLLTINGPGNTTVSNMGISGGGGLTYGGAGTLTLGATNSYTGSTTINSGTVRLTGSLAAGSEVTVGGTSASGASGSPTLSGGGTVNGSLTVFASGPGNVAGHLAPSGFTGSSATALNVGGDLTLNNGSVLDFNLSNIPDAAGTSVPTGPNGFNDHVAVSGNLSLNGGGVLNINDVSGLSAGTYELVTYGTLSGSTAGWTVGGTPPSGFNVSFSTDNSGQFDLVVTTASGSGEWIASSGNGGTLSYLRGLNWSSGTDPDGPGQSATFGTGNRTMVQIDGKYTVGSLNFTSGSAYSLSSTSASNGLTLNNGGAADAQINVADGGATDFLYTQVNLASTTGNTTITVQPGSSLFVSAFNIQPTNVGLAGSNQGITLAGGGTLELAATNTYSGPTHVNAGTLLIDAGASIKSTSITVGTGATLQLAGTTGALPSGASIKTSGNGDANDGAIVLTGGTTESVGAITSDPTTNGDGAQVYAGNTTVGDGASPANLTATQILQNTLTINAGSTVTIAPSAGAGGGVVAAASSASAASASSAASADITGDSGSDPLAAIQDAIALGSISSATGQRLENRIAAIERLAATDPGLDVSLLEGRVLAALPSSSILPATDSSPLADGDSGLFAVGSGAIGSASSAAFAPAAGFNGNPAAVPEPSTLLLAALGVVGAFVLAARRRMNGGSLSS